MKKLPVFLLTILICAGIGASALAESRIIAMSGIVRVSPPAEPGKEQWTQAVVGQPLPDGTRVMTAENARVAIEVSPGNTVRLRSNAQIVVGAPRGSTTRFKLVTGTLRGVFKKLTGGERFELEFSSMSAVASVKGTTFEARDGQGGVSLRTILGAIDMILSNGIQSVPQGCGLFQIAGGVLQVRPLTDGEVQEGLGNNGADGRGDLQSFINSSRESADANQNLVEQIREDDFAVGRSLRDVHGNLARVDQRLLRPNPAEIQFVNIVSRASYQYRGKFSYGGSSGARFDYLEGTIHFNMNLPANVADWPVFFTDNKDTLKALNASVTLANGRKADATLTITKSTSFGDNEGEAFFLNGSPFIVSQEIVKGEDADGSDTDSLWATERVPAYADSDNNGQLSQTELNAGPAMYLQMEAYVLNSSGKILTIGDFTGNGLEDPFGFAKSISMEGILSVSDHQRNPMYGGNNIDLIVIPDLAVAIAQRYGASLATVDTGN